MPFNERSVINDTTRTWDWYSVTWMVIVVAGSIAMFAKAVILAEWSGMIPVTAIIFSCAARKLLRYYESMNTNPPAKMLKIYPARPTRHWR